MTNRDSAMDVIDESQNPRLESLRKLMLALEQSHTPFETLRAIRRGFGETYGRTSSILLSTQGVAGGEYRIVQLYLGHDDAADDRDPWAPEERPLHRGGLVAQIVK